MEQNVRLEEELGRLLKELKLSLSTAESCTGGSVAAKIVSVPGSSVYFKGGIVAYSNEIKERLLQVSPETLEQHGAVSKETVMEMVKGAMKTMDSDCAIATSGIAGPDGGTAEKPVGTIWIAVANKDEIQTWMLSEDHGRDKNMQNAVRKALFMLYNLLK